ncbi:DUF6191 domain-containing protein [Rhodococcus sp. O3]|uniref:DUF6191 domain-containing protein n=1 Tax=Rhodococcus sp. O3 TaxID=3404919 RepID=UPI003B676B45
MLPRQFRPSRVAGWCGSSAQSPFAGLLFGGSHYRRRRRRGTTVPRIAQRQTSLMDRDDASDGDPAWLGVDVDAGTARFAPPRP